eukprot:2454104-Rhodomonas_salina.1
MQTPPCLPASFPLSFYLSFPVPSSLHSASQLSCFALVQGMKPSEIPGFKEHFECCKATFHLQSGDAKDGTRAPAFSHTHNDNSPLS